MSTTTPTGTSNKEMVRKIIIGTVSTVLAALIIYFIVDRGGSDRDKKKATLSAWDSYSQNKDIFKKVMSDLSQSMKQGIGTLEQAKADFTRDIDMSIANMENIKLEDNVDNRMLSLIDISVSQLKEVKTILLEMMGKLEVLAESDITEQQLEQSALSYVQELADKLEGIKSRDKLRISSFRDELCKKYGGAICPQ